MAFPRLQFGCGRAGKVLRGRVAPAPGSAIPSIGIAGPPALAEPGRTFHSLGSHCKRLASQRLTGFQSSFRRDAETSDRDGRATLNSHSRAKELCFHVAGFTLLEILVASAISAIILVAVYGFFQRALKTRDSAIRRMRDSAIRARAESVIRNDLRNGFYSGGAIASSLTASKQGPTSRFPGFLRFTTTTGRDDDGYGDVQQVEYSLADATSGTSANSQTASSRNFGTLVRAVTRDRELLASIQSAPRQENLLTDVESFEASFYDGSSWQTEWQASGTTSAVPLAVKVRIQPAPTGDQAAAPAPIEIEVPWSAQPIVSSTNSSATSATGP